MENTGNQPPASAENNAVLDDSGIGTASASGETAIPSTSGNKRVPSESFSEGQFTQNENATANPRLVGFLNASATTATHLLDPRGHVAQSTGVTWSDPHERLIPAFAPGSHMWWNSQFSWPNTWVEFRWSLTMPRGHNLFRKRNTHLRVTVNQPLIGPAILTRTKNLKSNRPSKLSNTNYTTIKY